MRLHALWLLLASGYANAGILDVSVTQGSGEPQFYHYDLGDDRVTLDLRDSHRHMVAVKDVKRGKEICREAEYRTGIVLTLRKLPDEHVAAGSMKVELVGQLSVFKELEAKEVLSCGQNTAPVIEHKGFSDTSIITPGKPKAIVVDGTTTIVLTVK